jgi:OFA family oxalate/formate antiporter-like MFS transporter
MRNIKGGNMHTTSGAPSIETKRWLQLLAGIACMVMIANLQYGWNLFVNPIDAKYHWGRATIQVAFTLFVLTETWLVPVEGWFVDRYGPRIVVAVGGILVAIAWVLNSYADSVALLYTAAIISGIGAGAVYGTCVGNALKWFADRRGLAAGLTAAGFGAGAAATVVPIRQVIDAYGYEQAFFWFGLGQGVVILMLSQMLKAPAPGAVAVNSQQRNQQSVHQYHFAEMLRTPLFWVMYIMFVLVAAGGLMATAQLASIAEDFGVANTPVNFLWITGTTLTIALTVDNVLNGLARPFFGWMSDQIGRENTMFIVFCLGAVSILALGYLGNTPWSFIALGGAVYFTWGEIYSLFPSMCTDSFGTTYAATNAGALYTAKGTAALLVPLANVLTTVTGNWHSVFAVASIMNAVAALMAIFLLKPLRSAHHQASAKIGSAVAAV